MIESIGQDITNHLHEPGGPLAPEPERYCTECEAEIEEGRYHAIGKRILCDRCAPTIAIRILLSPDTKAALDVLRQFAKEHAEGEWRR